MPDENISSQPKQGKRAQEGVNSPPSDQVYDAKTGARPLAEGEVIGHNGGWATVYTCYAGDWTGFIPAGWDWFICPNGHLNYIV